MIVSFRDIAGFPGYRVGDDGSVWSRVRSRNWKQLRPQISGRDRRHHKVILTRNGEHVHRYIHHLVLEAFIGPCPPGLEACHANDNGFDNRLGNLRWDTRSSNRVEGYRNGVNHGGSKHYKAKLTEEGAIQVISMIRAGKPNEEIAAAFGVTRGAIHAIRSGRTWKHLLTL
jgi:hypothetical protein